MVVLSGRQAICEGPAGSGATAGAHAGGVEKVLQDPAPSGTPALRPAAGPPD